MLFNWEEKYTEHSLEEAVKRCVKVYGIEGTEEKVQSILSQMPTFKDRFLKTLYRLYNFGKDKT